jgi:hypothetical protein
LAFGFGSLKNMCSTLLSTDVDAQTGSLIVVAPFFTRYKSRFGGFAL